MRRVLTILLTACLVVGAVAPVAGAVTAGDATGEPVGAVPTAGVQPTTDADVTADTDATADANVTNVTILSFNDVQTAAAVDGNFSRLATAIAERRAANGRTVVVGAGDEVGPHALSPVSQWRAPVDVLNEIDPAADTIGNHEFDYGYEGIAGVTNRSTFPWLATNIVNSTTGEPFQGTDEYEIVNRSGVRVGIIGLIDRGAAEGKTNIDLSERGATLQNYTEDGPATAKRLKQNHGVDVVVALAHTGVPDAKALARADGGGYIDAVAVGDDEIVYPPQETSDTVITEAEARAKFLGELTLRVDTQADDVVGFDGRLIPVGDFQKNETASRIINDYRAAVSLDSPAGNTTTPLDSRFSTSYHVESAYGNLITDAMRAETGASVAITNAGGIRSNTVYAPNATPDNPVPVTGGDVFSTLPFANTLVTYEMNGSQLREVLASQVVTLESETGQQFGQEISQQVSGVRFEWVGHERADRQVRELYVNTASPTEPAQWERVHENATYNVTLNSFIGAGGSGYPLPEEKRVVSRTDKLLAVTVIEYFQQRGTVSPQVEGRIQRVDRDLPDREVTLDGNGKVVLTYDSPGDLTGLDADSLAVTTPAPGSEAVSPERVIATPHKLIVRFDDAALRDLAGASQGTAELELYAGYSSAEYGPLRVYFEDSRLNGDITATLAGDRGRGNGGGNGAG